MTVGIGQPLLHTEKNNCNKYNYILYFNLVKILETLQIIVEQQIFQNVFKVRT